MRAYIIVITEADRTVVKVFESKQMTILNAKMVSKAVSERWRKCAEKYPAPTYDVLDGSADSKKELMEMLPEISGWDSIRVTSIPTPEQVLA